MEWNVVLLGREGVDVGGKGGIGCMFHLGLGSQMEVLSLRLSNVSNVFGLHEY